LALALDYWRANLGTAEIDYDKALAEFALAQRGLPNDAEIYGLLGQVQRHRGRWMESTDNFKRAALLDPNSVERSHRLFGNYYWTRNYAAADEALTHTLALAPAASRWRYKQQRAFLHLFWKGDVSEIEQLDPPPADDPAGPHTEEVVACKILQHDYRQAEKIVLSDEREVFAWGSLSGAPKSLVLGRIYLYAKNDAKARTAFEAARVTLEHSLEANPLDANQRMFLAEAYAGLGRKEEAIREARHAAEMIPESKDAYYGIDLQNKLVRIYVLTHEFDLALPIIEHSLGMPAGFFVNDLRFSPFWDDVRRDPRFQKLLAKFDRS
jgi:tetratricopeptide (TPR) repeat protein